MTTAQTQPKVRKDKKAMAVPCVQINVLDLKVGDRFVTVFSRTDDPETGSRMCLKSAKVEDKEECPGKWRTHVHVNKRECHDSRGKIWVVA